MRNGNRQTTKLSTLIAATLVAIGGSQTALADDAGYNNPKRIVERAPSIGMLAGDVSGAIPAADSSSPERSRETRIERESERESELTRSERLWKRVNRFANSGP